MKIESDNSMRMVGNSLADGPRLLADIGATYGRFALETEPGVFQAVRVLQCDEYSGLLPLLKSYLADHRDVKLQHAALALANPISGDLVKMTDRDWSFSIEAVRRELGLHTLLVVNDFTALAMSLPGLKVPDRQQIGGGTAMDNAVIGLLGPGTGLGVSGLIPTADGFVTLCSEGGHVSFAPADEREYAILKHGWEHWGHVSAERLVSGPGIELIYLALAARNGQIVNSLTVQEILSAALEQGDRLSLETLECFCGMLGGVAGDLAVTLGATGGIYIGAGIVPRLGQWFASSPFRARFEAKGRFSTYLSQIPSYVITASNPAFRGVSAILSEHLRGRHGTNSLMDRILQLQVELTPAEQRVASLVLAHPRTMINEPIAEIARLAEVSQPTVIRFCRSLGFLGLADFKLKFASSLTGTISVRHTQVRMSDSTSDLSVKVIDNTVSAILQFRDQLEAKSVERAIGIMRQARRVEFYAMGNSRVVALDGQHKFFRFRIPTASYGDSHLFCLAAQLLKPGDVVIAISNTGKAQELLEAVDIALSVGADVIAFTSRHSPLAKRATVCLAVDHTEDSTMFLSMISRILHLLLIDILSVGVSFYAENTEHGSALDSETGRLLISHLDS